MACANPTPTSETKKDDANSEIGSKEPQQPKERVYKESIINLAPYLDKKVYVKFIGGREATGILKGFDPLMNLVLEDTQEKLRDPSDRKKMTEETRQLGMVVCRGTNVMVVSPADGYDPIPNPFVTEED